VPRAQGTPEKLSLETMLEKSAVIRTTKNVKISLTMACGYTILCTAKICDQVHS